MNDPALDQLRDDLGNLFGRTPMQGWLKPESVSWHVPPQRTFLDLLQGTRPADPPELEFVIHTPWLQPRAPLPRVRPSRRTLEEFLSLASAPNEALHSFASRFGALLVFYRLRRDRLAEHQLMFTESCWVWRYFAASMRALLRIGASFHSGRTPDAADWDIVGNPPLPLR